MNKMFLKNLKLIIVTIILKLFLDIDEDLLYCLKEYKMKFICQIHQKAIWNHKNFEFSNLLQDLLYAERLYSLYLQEKNSDYHTFFIIFAIQNNWQNEIKFLRLSLISIVKTPVEKPQKSNKNVYNQECTKPDTLHNLKKQSTRCLCITT